MDASNSFAAQACVGCNGVHGKDKLVVRRPFHHYTHLVANNRISVDNTDQGSAQTFRMSCRTPGTL
jgi:hypothetical protein